ncbi:2-oxo acid dehydrogenase subunit E2 [Flavobacteriaceae bacterium]|nr:2-oxo acid dehydrogenase subunit E2 [Flavobacteriaceae bacterium]
MAIFELKLPKMGESVAEATITSWLKSVGETIEQDEAVVEIATDKVDSEVPSEVTGVIKEILFQTDDVVEVGQTIALIEVEGDDVVSSPEPVAVVEQDIEEVEVEQVAEKISEEIKELSKETASGKFLSPLVRNIAKEEGVSEQELENLQGSGKDGRITKNDILDYVKNRNTSPRVPAVAPLKAAPAPAVAPASAPKVSVPVSVNGGDEIIEMDRMRKLISGYMVNSLQTSAHVQSFIEVDVTNIVKWRAKVKDAFLAKEGEKITFTPIFMQAVAKTIRDFPMINISVDGDRIIKRRDINLGMATALPSGNLIVPVIKGADQLNLVGMTKAVNDLANRARNNALNPDDIKGGTYTVTNVGSFGSVMGTPIINQPEVAILALGAIRKVPAVIETPDGDFIGIRHKMFLSHSYDHRVVDGMLGGMFIKRLSEYLEAWDINTEI